MSLVLAFPQIDPVAVEIGPIVIRWYALAYVAGLVAGWRLVRIMAHALPKPIADKDVDDFLVWATLGVVLGGRLGYVLFYNTAYYLSHPLAALQVWQGGMSFHGGLLGVVVAAVLFSRQRGLVTLVFGDLLCAVAPIGLGLGRLANFVNGELFGRVAPDVAWAMVFPRGGPLPRHPSQLYEAGLEGLLLLAVLLGLWRIDAVRRRPGTIMGAFLIGYGLSRIAAEFFREPDAHLGFLWGGATMGQLLSLPMLAAGVGLVAYARRHPA